MALVVRLLQRSLKELYLSDCLEIRCDALLWIAGAIGQQNLVIIIFVILNGILICSKKGLKLLRCLDLSYCPIVDKGFTAIPPSK